MTPRTHGEKYGCHRYRRPGTARPDPGRGPHEPGNGYRGNQDLGRRAPAGGIGDAAGDPAPGRQAAEARGVRGEHLQLRRAAAGQPAEVRGGRVPRNRTAHGGPGHERQLTAEVTHEQRGGPGTPGPAAPPCIPAAPSDDLRSQRQEGTGTTLPRTQRWHRPAPLPAASASPRTCPFASWPRPQGCRTLPEPDRARPASSARPGPATLSPASPRSRSSTSPSPAASPTNTNEPRRSPGHDGWPTSGEPHRHATGRTTIRNPEAAQVLA